MNPQIEMMRVHIESLSKQLDSLASEVGQEVASDELVGFDAAPIGKPDIAPEHYAGQKTEHFGPSMASLVEEPVTLRPAQMSEEELRERELAPPSTTRDFKCPSDAQDKINEIDESTENLQAQIDEIDEGMSVLQEETRLALATQAHTIDALQQQLDRSTKNLTKMITDMNTRLQAVESRTEALGVSAANTHDEFAGIKGRLNSLVKAVEGFAQKQVEGDSAGMQTQIDSLATAVRQLDSPKSDPRVIPYGVLIERVNDRVVINRKLYDELANSLDARMNELSLDINNMNEMVRGIMTFLDVGREDLGLAQHAAELGVDRG